MKVYTSREIMELLKISKITFYKYIKAGKIKGSKIGNKWIFTEEQLKDFIDGMQNKG